MCPGGWRNWEYADFEKKCQENLGHEKWNKMPPVYFLGKIKETGQVLNSVHLNKHEKKRTLKTDEGPKSQMTTELS